jgi:hypothetical protein
MGSTLHLHNQFIAKRFVLLRILFLVRPGMLSYEAFYGRKCQLPLYWDNVSERQTLWPKPFQDTHEKVRVIKERMSAA